MRSKYKLKISGKNNDYFLHLLISKGINIYSLEKNKGYFFLIVDREDYKKIKKIKTSYKINIVKVYGLLYLKKIFIENLSFVISFLICSILLVLASNLILDIEVVTNDNHLKKVMLEDLKERGIYKYTFKSSFDRRSKVIKEIIEEEKDTIEWFEIESYGTKYTINIVERIKNDEEEKCTPRNIVAKKDAFVVRVDATSGEVLTAINRSVKKGDILISGNIYNKDEIVSTRCARGKVFGEVWYQVYVELPKHYHEENVTGRSTRRIGIEFFDYKSKSSYKTYKSKDINIFNNKLLPIRLYYTTYLETKIIDKDFTIDNVDDYAIEMATKKLKNKLGKEDTITYKKILKKEEKESRIIIGVFFKVEEDITMMQEIPGAQINNGE